NKSCCKARRFCAAYRSLQAVPVPVGAILRRADKHFDEVIMQRIVELALEAPFKLRMVEVAGMEIEIISVHRHGSVSELDDHLHAFALGPRREIQQRMLVEAELRENTVEARGSGFGHRVNCKGSLGWGSVARLRKQKSWQKLLAGPAVIFSCEGSFDCVVASLREPTTSPRMTRRYQ